MLTPGPTMGHGRVRTNRAFAFYAAAVLLALVLFGGAQGSLLAPLVGWVTMDRADPHFVHDVALSAVLLVAFLGAVAQVVRPTHNVAAAQLLAVVLTGVTVVGFLARGTLEVVVLPGLLLVVLALHPARAAVFQVSLADVTRRRRLLVAGAGIPMLAYGAGQALRQVALTDVDAALGHWGGMALLALATVVAAALSVTETPGHRFGAWSAGFLAGTLGLASLVSGGISGVGPVWGALSVVWAVTVVATDVATQRSHAPHSLSPHRRREPN